MNETAAEFRRLLHRLGEKEARAYIEATLETPLEATLEATLETPLEATLEELADGPTAGRRSKKRRAE